MKISNDKNVSLVDTLVKSANNRPLKESPAILEGKGGVTADKVELSGRKQEIQRITEKVNALSAVRQEKVDQIKEAIGSGTYNVKGEVVAKGMLKSELFDLVY